ncbi:phosphatase PAP2 family protein [Streptomyces sp. N2A]|uniref:phosphatase PAP2 family protein n=1 Tax=Streptomyces sp. N2A TaxID=3073936 RepID=UPI00287054E1|nr:phosphatase PAP2 family protein [Streptomyces sp. N2A]
MVTWQVAARGPLRAYDERLGRGIAGAREIPSPVAEFFADLGNTVVALPVLLGIVGLVMVLAWVGWRSRHREGAVGGPPRRWWLPPLAAGLALASVPALVVPLKLWLARPGPPQMAGGGHDGFFPSGHAATAAVAYGAAALLLIRGPGPGTGRAGRRTRGPLPVAVATTAVLLNLGVGVGLVRRGYHWPLDVLGSWCLAGVVLALWCAVCDRWVPEVIASSAPVGAPTGG